MSHVIGIDIGTSGIKVGAMNHDGELGLIEYQPYSLHYPQKGWVEIDLEDIWLKTKELLMKVITRVERTGTVDAISLSTFCNSSVFLNEDGEPLCPGIMYLDQRSKEEAEWIKEIVTEEKIYDITKNRLEQGMYSVTSHVWFKNHRPSLYEQTHKWGNLSTYILNKLTGSFVMDWTQASFSGMYNIEEYVWSKEICEEVGLEMEKLPEVVDPCSIVGELNCSELPLNGIPVAAGGADTACSTLALGVQPGEVFESVGTSNVLTACTKNPDNLDRRFLNRCHIKKNQWLSHGAMSFPGAAIQWFYEEFLKEEGDSRHILEELPKQSPIGSNGVFFLPYMQGERSPIWDPDARGTFTGISLNTTKADMMRAILEGCSFGLRQINDILLDAYHVKFESLPSIGGGSSNQTWAQVKANILEKNIEIKDVSETGVYGACLIAGTSAGYYKTFEEASELIENQTTRVVKPNTEEVNIYNEHYQVFKELYPSLKPFFAKSMNL
ncbi:carbohydrate kinase [Halobacillus andaensis]|uniref:Carbohydrate kinase n=1 Tax=Halobacillus andaensis TaxID=1176239 RepID=A0A917B5A3_HALAA|nr:FGGY family carbohydrate kinase [Halobacillus andaensis]MBP2004275.1 xylulokinase [Halobacillus andaensis]GGF22920.1 carbohydrate kinase [Halobacillus andaensis]